MQVILMILGAILIPMWILGLFTKPANCPCNKHTNTKHKDK